MEKSTYSSGRVLGTQLTALLNAFLGIEADKLWTGWHVAAEGRIVKLQLVHVPFQDPWC